MYCIYKSTETYYKYHKQLNSTENRQNITQFGETPLGIPRTFYATSCSIVKNCVNSKTPLGIRKTFYPTSYSNVDLYPRAPVRSPKGSVINI